MLSSLFNLALVSDPLQSYLVYTFIIYFPMIHFNTIHLLTSGFYECYVPIKLSNQSAYFSFDLHVAHIRILNFIKVQATILRV